MPHTWFLGSKTARWFAACSGIEGRRNRRPARAKPSQRLRLQLEALEDRRLLSASDLLVVTTQPPSSITAGTSFGLVVKAEDALGNVDTSFNGSVTVSSEAGKAVAGTLTVTAVNGVATFSGLVENTAASDALQVSATGQLPGSSNIFGITAAHATQLVVSSPSKYAPYSVQVQAEDPFGNVDPTFNSSVTVSLTNNSTGASLGGTLTATAVNGIASFDSLTINNLGTGYTLQATSTGLTAGTSPAFNVTDQLVVTTPPPSTITAGTPFGLVVTVEDGLGSPDTTFNGSVTIANKNGYPLGGNLTVNAVNGVATFSGLTDDLAGTYQLITTASGLGTATTGFVEVTAAAATHLAINWVWLGGVTTVVPEFANVLANAPISLEVVAEDQFGNVDPNFSGTATLALANNPTGATLGGPLTVTIIDRAAEFNGLTINALGSGYTLMATTSSSSLTGTSAPFDVTTDKLVVTTPPPDTYTPGVGFGLTVSAEDRSGNVDTSFNGTITASLFGSGPDAVDFVGGPVSVTAVNGVATFTGLTLDQQNNFTIFLTSNGVTGTATTFVDEIQFTGGMAQLISNVQSLPASSPSTFQVSWSGSDSLEGGGEIASYTIFVSDNGGPYTSFLTNTTNTSALFTGQPGHTYSFYSVATDTAGNVQKTPLFAQATTTVASNLIPQNRFVSALYRDVLGRDADAAGLSNWVDQLQAGVSQQQVVQAFWQSPEHRTLEITSYYQTLLQRNPDSAGLAQWVQMMGNGTSENAVELAFLTSQEYLAKHPFNTDFIAALYTDVLGRTASATEVAYWQNLNFEPPAGASKSVVQTEGELAIAANILHSPEASTQLIDQYYAKFLQRAVDPNGENNWLAFLQGGASPTALGEAILGSGEYYTLATSS